MSDLQRCPFCNGKAKREQHNNGARHVRCVDCGGSTAWHAINTPWEQIEPKWNRRYVVVEVESDYDGEVGT